MNHYLTAIIHREGEGYVALCPELEIASQGDSIEEARDNLKEAVQLFLECASPEEIERSTKGLALHSKARHHPPLSVRKISK